ncbi:MAG: helix-turn-helix domain-containing protein [Actinomycetota bacterium]|nr:helix-turn-helix domain-containing protein [Actinomycetota bacterium]
MRPLTSERNLARRIEMERDHRGMSYAGLAKRMTDLGIPMQKTTIFKIEKGDPPRRVSIDELVGFARVFDLEIDEILRPPSELMEAYVVELIERFQSLSQTISDAVVAMAPVLVEGRTAIEKLPDLRTYFQGPSADLRYPKYVQDALLRVERAVVRWGDETSG